MCFVQVQRSWSQETGKTHTHIRVSLIRTCRPPTCGKANLYSRAHVLACRETFSCHRRSLRICLLDKHDCFPAVWCWIHLATVSNEHKYNTGNGTVYDCLAGLWMQFVGQSVEWVITKIQTDFLSSGTLPVCLKLTLNCDYSGDAGGVRMNRSLLCMQTSHMLAITRDCWHVAVSGHLVLSTL